MWRHRRLAMREANGDITGHSDHGGQAVKWSSFCFVRAAVTFQSQPSEVFEYEIVFLVGIVTFVTRQQIMPTVSTAYTRRIDNKTVVILQSWAV